MDKITRTSYNSNDKKQSGGLKIFSLIMLCGACVALGYVIAGALSGLLV